MSLSDSEINAILARKEARKRAPRGEGVKGVGGKKIDPNERTHQTWFGMIHRVFDYEAETLMKCSNQNCIDPRDRTNGQTVVEIKGQYMCRYCFLDGWLVENPAQQQLPVDG